MNAIPKCTDPVILNLWHVVGDVHEVTSGTVYQTVLLEERVSFAIDDMGAACAWRSPPSEQSGDPFDPARPAEKLPALSAYAMTAANVENLTGTSNARPRSILCP